MNAFVSLTAVFSCAVRSSNRVSCVDPAHVTLFALVSSLVTAWVAPIAGLMPHRPHLNIGFAAVWFEQFAPRSQPRTRIVSRILSFLLQQLPWPPQNPLPDLLGAGLENMGPLTAALLKAEVQGPLPDVDTVGKPASMGQSLYEAWLDKVRQRSTKLDKSRSGQPQRAPLAWFGLVVTLQALPQFGHRQQKP